VFLPLGIVTDWRRRPWANVGLIAVCVAAFWLRVPRADFALWSRDPVPHAFVTHVFLHADPAHLIGNMIFLWAFGNAANGRVHPALYTGFFLLAGILAGAAQLFATPDTRLPHGICQLGASGSIMAVAGLCLVLFPFHKVRGLFLFGWLLKRFEIRTFPLALFYAALDFLYLTWRGHDGVGYAAHLAGFATGVAGGVVFLKAGWVHRDGQELLGLPRQKPVRRVSRLLHEP
jgi:membrane associated rhomboid family serine protease